MRVLAIANQKGGVGKTTTAINLGTALAAAGKRVLIFDTDPQGNASTGIDIHPDDRAVTSYDVLVAHHPLSKAVMPTKVPNLFITPGDARLSGVEGELMGEAQPQFFLRNAIDLFRSESSLGVDYILIDCPPSLNILTVNALTASEPSPPHTRAVRAAEILDPDDVADVQARVPARHARVIDAHLALRGAPDGVDAARGELLRHDVGVPQRNHAHAALGGAHPHVGLGDSVVGLKGHRDSSQARPASYHAARGMPSKRSSEAPPEGDLRESRDSSQGTRRHPPVSPAVSVSFRHS